MPLRDPAAALPATMRVFERGWLSSNNILFLDGDNNASLVDTGYVSHREQTLALVQSGLGGRRLSRIFSTHLHSDHCGGNAHLQRATGARIAIPPGLADAVARWDEDALTFRATGQVCDRFRHDDIIRPGATLRLGEADWQALAAPGHDPHSIMLWNAADRILISADALWEHGFGGIFPEIEGESGFAEQAAMLELIAKLSPRLVIPGHGALFTDVDAALGRAHRRLAALSADPARNARQVAKALIKFYLLDVRALPFDRLVEHLAGARYFNIINERYFRWPFDQLIAQIVRELAAVGAAEFDRGVVSNRDHAAAAA
jgi:glyoxylase-like metal-dependent hydrolase (beta-lactamase superfamily II)